MHIIFLILDTYVCSQILSAYIIIYFKFLTDRAPSAIEEPADSVDTTNRQTSSKVREYSRREVQVELCTTRATIGNLHSDWFAFDYK